MYHFLILILTAHTTGIQVVTADLLYILNGDLSLMIRKMTWQMPYEQTGYAMY
jgi:hypothetical protein